MNYSRTKLLIVFISLLLLVTISQCKEPTVNKADPVKAGPVLDTGRIHEQLRQYEALTSTDSQQKDAMLRSITVEAIAMGYNDKACELLREYGRHYADRGNFDSSLF